jgi:GDP-L-fucose synthase
MQSDAKVFVAGHRGLAGSAIVRQLLADGHLAERIIRVTHEELDLLDADATAAFFRNERPQYVFLCAAKVGGILANNTYPAQFIRENLVIQTNVIHSAYETGVDRLMFLGSSCIYPKLADQPLQERSLLTGQLEATNRPYAIAKIAGIEMCWSYNRQYGTQFLAAMPTNLYGPSDSYDLSTSHVLPALIRKFHTARRNGNRQVVVWGSGTPRREFLYSDDMAAACVHLMRLPWETIASVTSGDGEDTFDPPLINVGVGTDTSIADLARLVQEIVGFEGEIVFDTGKPDGTPQKLLDISRLQQLGFTPSVGLREGIARAYDDFLRFVETDVANTDSDSV